MYNILIGGAAGQGIETTASILQKFLKNAGYSVLTTRDFMSRVRGGHNFSLIRFGTETVLSHSNELDLIIAFNEETVELHKNQLKPEGVILCDTKLNISLPGLLQIDMAEIGRELGNPRVVGSVAVGAVLKLFGIKNDNSDAVLKEFIKSQYIEVNRTALQRGYELLTEQFPYLNGHSGDNMLISGTEAIGLGALAAGLRFYSAYPMSPSTGILEYLASKGEAAQVVVEQAEDEIAAINMAIGASFAGATAMTGTSGGGFCLMVEALGLSGIAEIPLVVVDAQRPGPATGLPTRTEQSDLKFVISASHGEFPRMVIALRNHKDAFYQTARALGLAEKYQIPVILLTDQYLGDSSATVKPYDLECIEPVNLRNTPDEKEGEYLRYRFTAEGISPRLLPGKTRNFVAADSDEHDERGWIIEDSETRIRMMDKRMGKLKLLEEELLEPEFIGTEDFDTLFLGWGSTYGPIAEAVQALNQSGKGKYAALLFGDIYPLPKKLLTKMAPKAKTIINIEQNATGQLAQLIREQTGIPCQDSILKYDGRQISGEEIVKAVLKEVSL